MEGNKLIIQAGTIFVNKWGYDQTNCDFFKVMEESKVGKMAKVVQIQSRMVPSEGYSDMAGKCVAHDEVSPHHPQVLRKKLQPCVKGACFKVHKWGSYAYPWDGQPEYVSWYA